jgi:ribosomal protein L24E
MTDKSCSVEMYVRVNSLSIDWRSKKCFRYTTIYDDLGGMHIRRVIRCQKEDKLIAASRYPDGAEWAREYVLSHYSDTEALAAFTEIARQQEGPAR